MAVWMATRKAEPKAVVKVQQTAAEMDRKKVALKAMSRAAWKEFPLAAAKAVSLVVLLADESADESAASMVGQKAQKTAVLKAALMADR